MFVTLLWAQLLQEQANSESKLEDIVEAETHADRGSAARTPSGPDQDQDRDQDQGEGSHSHDVSLASAGDYSAHYTTLTSIGKGAFGFVKLGRRRADRAEVVVKFIRRAKVLKESWVKDGKLGVVPMEVFLLARLQHPNVVKVQGGQGLFVCFIA